MANGINFEEYAGVRGLVIAPMNIAADGTESYGAVEPLSGVQAVSGEVNESSETHYYDDMSAIVVDSEGDDTYTLTVSVPSKRTRALIEGLTYDEATGALIGTKKKKGYFALGFIGGKLNGADEYNWIYKGKFSGGGKTHNTKTDGIEATNMEYTYTSIHSGTAFAKGGNAKYLSVDNDGTADLSTFFDQVTTPDDLHPAAPYNLQIVSLEGTTVTVMRSGVAIGNGAGLNTGDVLTISVTGGTLLVNGSAFTSGNTFTVATSDVVIVATPTAEG